jgi:hypothetical protein
MNALLGNFSAIISKLLFFHHSSCRQFWQHPAVATYTQPSAPLAMPMSSLLTLFFFFPPQTYELCGRWARNTGLTLAPAMSPLRFARRWRIMF